MLIKPHPQLNVSVTVIITNIRIVFICFVNIYAAGIIKNNKQYQLGVERKKLVWIELASTEADSTAHENKPTANINIYICPNQLDDEENIFYIKCLRFNTNI